jgi:hypothetical protein
MAKAASTMMPRPAVPPVAEAVPFEPKRVVAFFLLAYGISWAWMIPWAATGHSIGGAGTFDGIFVTGIIAVLLARGADHPSARFIVILMPFFRWGWSCRSGVRPGR